MYVLMNAGVLGSQKWVSDPVALELQVVVSHSECVLRTELSSSAWAVHTLN